MKLCHFGIGSQNMILVPKASASPSTLLEMQIVGPHLGHIESASLEVRPSSLFFNKLPDDSNGKLRANDWCCEKQLESQPESMGDLGQVP